MKDMFVLYTFMALMTFNLLASFVYIFGLNSLKPAFKKTLKHLKPR